MPKLEYTILSDRSRNACINDINELVQNEPDKYKDIINTFGPKGKVVEGTNRKEEFDSIEIPELNVPGMDPKEKELLTTAIIVGTILNPKDLNKVLTSSSNTGDLVGFNQLFILDDMVYGDFERQEQFPDLLIERKKQAVKNIQAFNRGRTKAAKEALDVLIEHALHAVSLNSFHDLQVEYTSDSVYRCPNMAIHLALELAGKPPLNAGDNLNEIDKIKIKSLREIMASHKRSFELKKDMIDHPTKKNSPERQQQVADLLFEMYIAELEACGFNKLLDVSGGMIPSLVEKMGFDENASIRFEGKIIEANRMITSAYGRYKLDDLEFILAQENGKEKLRALCMEKIKSSDLYETMVDADADKLPDVFKFADSYLVSHDLRDIGVKTHNEAAAINKLYENDLKKGIKKVENYVFERGRELYDTYARSQRELEECTINSFTPQNLNKNADIVARLYNELDDADETFVKSSPQFKEMKEALVALKNYARKLADQGKPLSMEENKKYLELARKTDKLATVYLEGKMNSSSPRARKRMGAVSKLKRQLSYNTEAFANVYGQYEKQKLDDLNGRMELNSLLMQERAIAWTFSDPVERGNENPYKQKVNKNRKFDKRDGSQYTVERTAIYSIALMRLASKLDENGKMKYSIDDLINTVNMADEKSEAFDEVVEHIYDNNPDNQKWIAEQMYFGLKNLRGAIDEYVSKMDFNDPKTMKDVKAQRLSQLSYHLFDIYQEVSHCSNEFKAVAEKDNPKNKGKNVIDSMTEAVGPFFAVHNTWKDRHNAAKKFVKGDRSSKSVLFDAVFNEKITEKLMQYAQNNNIPYTKILDYDSYIGFSYIVGTPSEKYGYLLSDKIIDKTIDKIADGSLFKDVKIKINPKDRANYLIITGMPTVEQINKDSEYANIPSEILESFKTRTMEEYNRRGRSYTGERKRYMDKAKDSLSKLTDMMKENNKLIGEDRVKAEGYIRDIFAERFVNKFIKAGLSGEELDKAVNRTISRLPEFQKATDYIGIGTLAQFAFENKADKVLAASKDLIEPELKARLEEKKYAAECTAALNRLKNDHYTDASKVINDVAGVFTARIIEVMGELPENPVTKQKYSLSDYKKAIRETLSPMTVFKSVNSLDTTAKTYASLAENEDQIRHMVSNVELRTRNVNRNNNRTREQNKPERVPGRH